MKKIMVVFAAVLCAGVCMARPYHHGWHGGPHYYHHHHHSYWGHGGCHFWPGFVGGVVGGVIGSAIVPPYRETVVVQPAATVVTQPVVVQQPVVQPVQNVWVEGRYVDQVQANGSVVRVWQPGHYEQR